MFMKIFDLMSNIFYFPLIWFEKILDATGMDGSKGIFLAAFTVLLTSQLLLHPIRGSGSSDRARKKGGMSAEKAENRSGSRTTTGNDDFSYSNYY